MHARQLGFALVATLLTSTGVAQAQQSLKVAGQDSEPFVVHAKTSTVLSGIAVDLINAIGKDAGFQVQFQPMAQGDLIPALTSGKIEIIASNLAITPERKQQVDFANPYHLGFGESLVVLKNDTTQYKTLADLKGVAVGSQRGSVQLDLLQKTGGFSEVKVYDRIEDAWAAVGAGQIKAALTAGSTTVYHAKQGRLPANVQLANSYQPILLLPVGIAVKKGNAELLGRINKSQSKLAADGALKTMFAKYGFDWVQPK